MARFDQVFKDEVRARNDIVEVISSYVKLERRGNRYVGLCPFHSEKTPSFHVIPDQQFYHCFGCKASGDVFRFVQEREHLTFYEAVVLLAKRAGLALPQEERTPEEERAYRERRAMYEALDLAARIFHHHLMEEESGQAGLAYLTRRGLTAETIQRYRLGWAPGRGTLFRSLRGRFAPELLQKIGLILPRRDGSGYTDAFFDRVMFPIADLSGRVIGFGGRILEGDGAKYKNTAETPLFSKRHVLFGLDHAKESMRARSQAILVEGYMDVITPHQAGIQNIVAPLGTALTDDQCRLIRQQAEQAIVAFDMDTAGQMATLRGLEKLYETGCDVRILQLPDGKDPDEFVRTHGPAAFQEAVAAAMPLIEFKLRNALARHAGNDPETKNKALEAVAQVLADVKHEVLRAQYVDQVAGMLSEGNPMIKTAMKLAIDREMNRLLRQGFQHNLSDSRNNRRDAGLTGPDGRPSLQPPAPRPQRPTVMTKATPADLVRRAERTLLFLLLEHPVLTERIESALGANPFGDEMHRIIYETLRPLCADSDPFAQSSLVTRAMDRLSDSEARLVLTEMIAKPMVSGDPEKEAADCIEKIRKHRDSRRIEDLSNLIRAAEASGQKVDPAIVLELTELLKRQKPSKS